jgi:hypothetical protein
MNGDWTEKVLHNFNGKDGANPAANLIFDHAGNLYGTTLGGGYYLSGCDTYGCGTVFEVSRHDGDKWTERVLHSFKNADGSGLHSSLVLDRNGRLYGATGYGGTFGSGVVFELSRHANGTWREKVLHDFYPNNGDGAEPDGRLVLTKPGTLYGTTAIGGSAGEGTVFEITP